LRTVAGDVLLAFYPEVAPESVQHFLELVRLGAYDTTHFGRTEPGFVVQVFNAQDRLRPLTEALDKALRPMEAEFSNVPHRRGILSFGREDNDPDSAVSSFSILVADAPHLDGKYTVFGHVERGMEVVDRLMEIPRTQRTSPSTRLTIWHAEVVSAATLKDVVLDGPRPLKEILEQTPPPSLGRRAYGVLRERCFRCHGAEKMSARLDLRTRHGRFQGGEHGPAIFTGNSGSSLLIKRVSAQEPPLMPAEGPPLGLADVSALAAWIDVGAPDLPDAAFAVARDPPRVAEVVTAEEADFWSFGPLKSAVPPAVKDLTSARNAIDSFLLPALQARGLKFNAEADRDTLVRRLSFDLLGMPPIPEEVDAFVSDLAPDAYERLVDRLLASPQFGERWARHWMDVARYADSNGYENDENRPYAYSYRDFVIRAFNTDLPFDTFVRWQIAGDELEPKNPLAVAATGFATAGPLQTFMMRKQDRYDELDDIVSTVGSALLGLTVGCARCHDHKFDPIPTRDYYRLTAVFASSNKQVDYLDADAGADYRRRRAPVDRVQKEFDTLRDSYKTALRNAKIDTLPISEAEKTLLRHPVRLDDPVQASLIRQHGTKIEVSHQEILQALRPDDRQRWKDLNNEVKNGETQLPSEPEQGYILTGSGVGRAFFLERGRHDRERDLVPPGFLTVLSKDRPAWNDKTWTAWDPPREGRTPLPRSALARWLTELDSGAGRLTARVIVNRLWQHHFGEGLVRTPNDFGRQGDRPVHPELLDFLARRLIEGGWQLKEIHRLIVSSSAYRQHFAFDAAKAAADPENRLFGRRRPQRLSAEAIRDAVLAAAGSLNRQMYGPGIKPPIPAEAIFPTAPKHGEVWPTNAEDGPATWRRSVYVITKRSNFVPFLQTFDAPDAASSCACRSTTTVPTQALLLMNDPFVRNQACRLADAVRLLAGHDPADQVRLAFLRTLSRPPTSSEAERALLFLAQQSLDDLCQVLFQTNEFLYVD
jgi:cyclophilin family peptidyl-prolyl cis-trans isomerase